MGPWGVPYMGVGWLAMSEWFMNQNVHCKRIMDCMGESQLLAWGPISLTGWNIFKKTHKQPAALLLIRTKVQYFTKLDFPEIIGFPWT